MARKKKKKARLTNLKQNKRNLRATTEEDTGRDQVGRGGDTAPSALGPAGRPGSGGALPSPCSNAASCSVTQSPTRAPRRGGMHLRGCKISRGSCSEPDLPARGAAPTPRPTRGPRRPRPSAEADRPLSRRPLRAAHPTVAGHRWQRSGGRGFDLGSSPVVVSVPLISSEPQTVSGCLCCCCFAVLVADRRWMGS